MAASRRRRDPDSMESWLGHGVPAPPHGPVRVLISPRLVAYLRRHVATIGSLSDEEREALRSSLGKIVRAALAVAHDGLVRTEREEIDYLLRRAGLPPLRSGADETG